ncbi:MAG: CotH kinase family protein [bacterium]|nr:CotH kinase family protein [bacterium]
MSTHKHIDKICCVVLAITLILTILFMNAEHLGIQKASTVMGYEKTLFDTSRVHTIDIIMDDWDDFISNCQSEAYYNCAVVIDNEAYKNVAIRGKGNTSLTQVEAYGNDRYSFKIEFDHYDSAKTYYGLDKLCLNNVIQDNTYLKDYLTFQMMGQMGVAAPLCSFAYITVNGEDWGLYLALEGVEESFLQRNYGREYGELYKPDSMSMGGGPGNGKKFDMDQFLENDNTQNHMKLPEMDKGSPPARPDKMPDDFGKEGKESDGFGGAEIGKDDSGRGGMMKGSDDVLLKYIDDEIDSYSNIFDNSKTDASKSDKTRLIKSLKKLSEGEDLEEVVAIDEVIRYFVVHNFVLNFDSYTGSMIHNYYLYEDDGRMQMIPWDYNLAFGGFKSATDATSLVNFPIDSPVSGGNVEDRPMIAWIFEDEEYTELYHEIFAEFIAEYFESGYFEEMIDSVSALIAPYVEKDPTKFCTYEEFETGVSTLKEFCMLRAESIRGQLEGTIGSRSDTQESDTLIDTGDIQINAMGSMNQTMGGKGKGAFNERPQFYPSRKNPSEVESSYI